MSGTMTANMTSITAFRAQARRAEEAFVTAYLSHARDVPQRLSDWLVADPSNPRAPATKAILLTTLARSELGPAAIEAAGQANQLLEQHAFSLADSAFVSAARDASAGLWHEAIRALDLVSRLDPSDTLAIKMAYAIRFMLGDATGMLSSMRLALSKLPKEHPHLGFLLGCLSFALEENGDYVGAERAGMEAMMLRPDDAWGLHAVSHVHEMTGRVEDGIRWIEGHEPLIRASNNFGGHLFWHLALFHLENGEIEKALALYDREVRREQTDDFRDIANAASLLMRIELAGQDVGRRWDEIADKAEARLEDRTLIFADLHYILALMGAGREGKALRFAHALETLPPRTYAQEQAWRLAGKEIGAGLSALLTGDAQQAHTVLTRLRRPAQLIGGSHAQRDILEQLTIEAGIRAGAHASVRRDLKARLAARGGHNLFAESRLGRLVEQASPSRGVLSLVASLAHGRDPAAHHA